MQFPALASSLADQQLARNENKLSCCSCLRNTELSYTQCDSSSAESLSKNMLI